MFDFPVIDTPPLESHEFSTSFEQWLSQLTTSLNDMFFVGKHNTDGASASISMDVPNVVSSHVAFAQIESSANPVTIQKVTPSKDKIDVLLSGAPGSAVISYVVYRI